MSELPDIRFYNTALLWSIPVLIPVLYLLMYRSRVMLRLPAWFFSMLSFRHYRHPDYILIERAQHQHAGIQNQTNYITGLIFYFVLLGLLLVALAQPYRHGQRLPDPPRYRDIMFVVDTSINMILRDYVVEGQRVPRIQMTQGVLSHFIRALQGNRIGIVVFSEQAYTLVPLTSDYALLENQLNRLVPATQTGRTINLSHALLYTYEKLSAKDHENRPVIVLLTSVNRPERGIDPRVVADFYRDNGYTLHTVAIGAPDYKGDEQQATSLIYHPANFKLLKDVASRAGGSFFWAKNTDSLGQAIDVIRQASLREVDVAPEYIEIPLYQWPLLAALLWLVLWQVFPFFRLPRLQMRSER